MASDIAAGHPAPQRRRVGGLAILLGLTGAPAAWIGVSLVNYAMTSEACSRSGSSGLPWTILLGLNLLGLAAALGALWISYEGWRRSHTEQAGEQQRTLEVGEGRTRFLALCGIVTSIGFAIGIAFAILPLLLVVTCV